MTYKLKTNLKRNLLEIYKKFPTEGKHVLLPISDLCTTAVHHQLCMYSYRFSSLHEEITTKQIISMSLFI